MIVAGAGEGTLRERLDLKARGARGREMKVHGGE